MKKLDDNIKSNGWGVGSIVNIENSVERLRCFELFDQWPFARARW